MVLLERIELSASPLPRVRSTTELQQPTEARPIDGRAANVKPGLMRRARRGRAFRMSEEKDNNLSRPQTKEERLAAKLRENLRRRKAQSREMRESGGEDLPKSDAES